MNRATRKMRSLAKRLIIYETSRNNSSGTKASAAFDIAEKLRPQLTNLVGNVGFRALLSRALALADAEVSWLRAVHVKEDGTLEELEAFHTQLTPGQFLEGRIVLLAQLFGLLVAFIGPGLAARLVGEVWPQLPLGAADFATERPNEKTK
jgi:hypothetical protein